MGYRFWPPLYGLPPEPVVAETGVMPKLRAMDLRRVIFECGEREYGRFIPVSSLMKMTPADMSLPSALSPTSTIASLPLHAWPYDESQTHRTVLHPRRLYSPSRRYIKHKVNITGNTRQLCFPRKLSSQCKE